jgi:hypothetical protein
MRRPAWLRLQVLVTRPFLLCAALAAGILLVSTDSLHGQQTCPCSIWSASTTPGPVANDGNAVELGVKFRADTSGFITGLRFYKYAQNTGTHVGNLWTTSGTLLGTLTFGGESASGWQVASFASPIAITAGTTYVASYHTNTGFYAAAASGLTASVDNVPLHALSDSASGGNGIYYMVLRISESEFNASFSVDVVFTGSAPVDTTRRPSPASPFNGATSISTNTNLDDVHGQ